MSACVFACISMRAPVCVCVRVCVYGYGVISWSCLLTINRCL